MIICLNFNGLSYFVIILPHRKYFFALLHNSSSATFSMKHWEKVNRINQGNRILALLLKAFSIPLLVWIIFPLTLFLQDQKGDT